jgi:long-chain acyl-CoA synthetase
MNTATLLSRAALEFPSRTAIAVGARSYVTFGGLAARVAELAAGLLTLTGARPGDRIAIFASNRPEYVEVLFACWWAGLAAVPINAKLHPKEVQHILGDSEALAVFTSPKLTGTIDGVVPADVSVVEMGSDAYAQLAGASPTAPARCEPGTLAWLFYTSGTTGFPKGAMISHANLMALVTGYLADVDALEPGDVLLHAAPMSHGSGLYILPFMAVGGVQAVPASGGFDEAELFDMIGAHPRSSLFAAPTIVKRMLRWAKENRPDHGNLRTVVYGGGPLYYDDLIAASAYFGNRFAQIYGQGECPMTITSMRRGAFSAAFDRRDEAYLRSVGVPFSAGEVRIKDENGNELANGTVGEVCVRSPAVCLGYWKDPEATAKTFRDGWLYTGDLGRFSENGVLVLAGRSKETIISGGTNIYPIEVEDVLLAHPDVVEAAVIGAPDSEWGEIVVAYVVASTDDGDLVKRLDRHCLENMARFKRPKHYRLVEELPKNNYGKVVKRALAELEQTRLTVRHLKP